MNFKTKEDELIAVRDWLLEANVILQEIEQQHNYEKAHIELEFLQKSIKIINKVFEEGNLRGMKVMMREYLEGFIDLTLDEAIEVDHRLCEKSGIGLKTVQKAIMKKVKEILKRGKVETADEYRILQTRADEISEDGASKQELDKIIDVLSAVNGTLDD